MFIHYRLRITAACMFAFLTLWPLQTVRAQEWVSRYNGPANGDDSITAFKTLEVDASGNSYVTGSSVGAGTGYDIITIKYDISGKQLWAARYNGPANRDDSAGGIAIDSFGNTYVTGQSEHDGTGRDVVTIKYDPNGNQLWAARFHGTSTGSDAGYAVAADKDGNAYVTGHSAASGTSPNMVTVKYDPSGNQVWLTRTTTADTGIAIALDSSGRVCVAGRSVQPGSAGTMYDWRVAKFDTDGKQLWVASYNGTANQSEEAYSIAVDAADNIYAAGYTVGTGTGYDYLTIKYDPNGNQLWLATYDGPLHKGDIAFWVAVDAAGNAYVTGGADVVSATSGIATIKYDTNGKQLWVARRDDPSGYAAGYWVALDGQQNVYVTGYVPGSGGVSDLVALKYDSNGNQLWSLQYNVPGGGDAYGFTVALDAAGNVYVAGSSTGATSGSDIVTLKIAQVDPPTTLTVNDVTGVVGETVSLSAKLTHTSSGAPIANQPLSFKIDGVAVPGSPATTDSNGLATLSYVVPEGTVGTHAIAVAFGGLPDADPSSGTGTLTVAKSATTLAIDNASGDVGSSITLKAKLTRNSDGGSLGGKNVSFKVDGTEVPGSPVVTNSSGVASVSFTFPAWFGGDHALTADFAGNGDYKSSSGSATVSANQYATTLTVPDVSGDAGKTVTLLATLTKSIDGTPVSGQPIAFTLNGAAVGTVSTDSSGQAKLSYPIPASTLPGTMSIGASFAGAPGFLAAAGAGTLTIRRPTTLTVTKAAGSWGATIPLKATLKNGTTVLPNETIRFRVDGNDVGSAVTSSTGVATLSHTLTETVGTHTLDAVFDGDTTYKPAVSSASTLTVALAKTTLSVASLTAAPNQTVNLKAILKSGTILLAGRDVTFQIDGNAVGTATTDGSGVALLAHVVTESLGTHAITADYAGDGVNYAACTATGSLKVLASTKIIADVLKAQAGSSVVYGAKLIRSDTGAPLEGKTINFYASTTFLGAATTDINGRATITTVAPAVGVKKAITVKFAGDAQYKASSGSGSITGT